MDRISMSTISLTLPITPLSENRCKNVVDVVSGDLCNKRLHLEEGREFCFHCEEIAAQDKELAEKSYANRENDRFKKIFNRFERESIINPKLLKSTFETYIPENDTQEKAKDTCMRYANNFSKDNPVNIMLMGSYGVGKSGLAVSITKVVMEKNIPTLFISIPKLLTKIQASWKGSDVSELEILQLIERVPLLVLDDIGAESDEEKQDVSSWAKKKIFEIVDSRIGRHTIFTTNLTIQQLLTTYGERNASRMLEDTTLISVEGANRRFQPKKKG